MSDSTPTNVPAGWYPDPTDPSWQRWWDGVGWTEHAVPAASVSAPVAQTYTAPYPQAPAAPSAPLRTDIQTNTAWIWLVVPPRREDAPTRQPVEWGRLLGSGTMQLLFAQQFLRGAAMVFYLSLFPKFLQEAHHVSEREAGELAMWPGVGAMVGALLGGVFSDAILRVTGHP